MAHGYGTKKNPGSKLRGGGNKQSSRAKPKPSGKVTSRKVHDTNRNKR